MTSSDELLRAILARVCEAVEVGRDIAVRLERLESERPSQTSEDDRLWSADEVAKYLGCSKATIYEKAEKGTIPAQRIGRCLRFAPDEIRRWVKNPQADAKVLSLKQSPRR